MTSFRALIVLPLLLALGLLVVAAEAAGHPAGLGEFFRLEILSARSLAVLGCLSGAFLFDRGDYLRRAWLILMFDYLLLVVNDVTAGATSEGQELLRFGLILGANLALVVGLGTFAYAVRRAGLELAGSRRQRATLLALAVVVAVVLGGGALAVDLGNTANRVRGLANAVSDLGDMAALVMVAPLAFTGLSLSGGVLAWPFVLLTLSRLMWLGFDAMGFLAPRLDIQVPTARAVEEVFRTAGCLYVVAAAIAHRLALRLHRS